MSEIFEGTPNSGHEPLVTNSTTRLGAEALFVAHARFVATFALRLGVPRGDIEDVVQETFLVAHRAGGFEPGCAQPTTWLAAITIRVWSTMRRTKRRRPESALEEDALNPRIANSSDVFQIASARQSLRRVEEALAALDEEHRGLFLLFEFEGRSCEELAQAFGVPLGTIYSRLHAVRQKLERASEAKAGLGVGRLTGVRA